MSREEQAIAREAVGNDGIPSGGSDAASLERPPERSEGHMEDLAAVRELALLAHPDTVPELVGGASVAEIVASLEPARAAYRRVAEHAGGSVAGASAKPTAAANQVSPVPAGDTPRAVVDPDRLSAAEKIRRGLAERQGG